MNDLTRQSDAPKATLIIPVYKDTAALACIFHALLRQTEQCFEVIITEDDESAEMAAFIDKWRARFTWFQHLTQKDDGFRKTVAVNRAIAVAQADYLIFLDGDCIPHADFINAHVQNSEHGIVCTGRRVDLGSRASQYVRKQPEKFPLLENRLLYLLLAPLLHIDGIRSYEVGVPNRFFHSVAKNRYLGIMGCNFSCYKEAMIKINGYDEDYCGSGGEDDDLEWRFNGEGIVTKNIKFLAPVYHLRAPQRRSSTQQNYDRLVKMREENKVFYCQNGLDKYLPTEKRMAEA